MIETYFTDKVTIFEVALDKFNRSTETETQHDARVDYADRIIRDQGGTDIGATYIVYISSDASVKIGDFLRVDELRGVPVVSGDASKKFVILRVFRGGDYSGTHIELTV